MPTKHAEPSKIIEKCIEKKLFLTKKKKEKKKKKNFISVSTKNISSNVLKISAISHVLRTREISDIFNRFDEIYALFS